MASGGWGLYLPPEPPPTQPPPLEILATLLLPTMFKNNVKDDH